MADNFRGFDAIAPEDREIIYSNLRILVAVTNMLNELGIRMPNQPAPPASQSAVDSLGEEEVEENGGQCHICLKEYEKKEVVKVMPCKHKYHSACIQIWLAKTNSCPLCRHELPTDDKHYEEYRKSKETETESEIDAEELSHSIFP